MSPEDDWRSLAGFPSARGAVNWYLADWCEGDPELLVQARTEVLRDTRDGPSAMVENNRHAIQLLELVRTA